MPRAALLQLLSPLLATVFAAALLTPVSHAQEAGSAAGERRYAVELVVFSRDGGGFEEIWPDEVALRYPDRARRLAVRDESATTTATQPPLWTSLGRNELTLRNSAAAIERQSGMRVLFHDRWIQPAQWQGRPAPIAITGGRAVGDHFELEGYVTLRVSRFLHFQTHLWLSEFTGGAGSGDTADAPPFRLPELPPRHGDAVDQTVETAVAGGTWDDAGSFASAPVSPSQVMTLQQQRRIRFGELHYFDHPRFGVLVQVTDYRPDEAAAAPSP